MPAINPTPAEAAANEEWMELMERVEVVKKMKRPVLERHLAILGWVPVNGVREALQNGARRVNIIEHERGLSASYYEHPHVLPRIEQPWSSISDGRLRMLAERIVHADWQKEHGYGP